MASTGNSPYPGLISKAAALIPTAFSARTKIGLRTAFERAPHAKRQIRPPIEVVGSIAPAVAGARPRLPTRHATRYEAGHIYAPPKIDADTSKLTTGMLKIARPMLGRAPPSLIPPSASAGGGQYKATSRPEAMQPPRTAE